jgi:hypothetical protein
MRVPNVNQSGGDFSLIKAAKLSHGMDDNVSDCISTTTIVGFD